MKKKIEAEFIEDGDYVHDDKCKRCGKCCQQIIFYAVLNGIDWNEYYYRRGCVEVPGVGMVVPSVCPHLRHTDNLKSDFRDQNIKDGYYCDIYETRPRLCKLEEIIKTTGLKPYLPKGCGYHDV